MRALLLYCRKAKLYYKHDLCLNPDRFDSWAASALTRSSLVDQQLISVRRISAPWRGITRRAACDGERRHRAADALAAAVAVVAVFVIAVAPLASLLRRRRRR